MCVLLGGWGAFAQPAEIGYSTLVENETLWGVVHDNISNKVGQGSGFRLLSLKAYPQQSLFREKEVGLNFEHVFNGTAADKDLCMFTPRRDTCTLEVHSPTSVTIHWAASESSWGLKCSMRYDLQPDGVSMEFKAMPTREQFPLGYCALMWASYMGRTRERRYHFWGEKDSREQWLAFGEDKPDGGFETGTVAHAGVRPLPYEEGAQTLNLIENTEKFFVLPFFYGLIDGDGNLSTDNDTLAYIMMFDQTDAIRFALWNFIQDTNHQPDPHSPAWDWQYVIREPKLGETYGYRAQLIILPYENQENVMSLFRQQAWREAKRNSTRHYRQD
ncbi:MAG: hypothetical protein HYZ00_06560 [Candidatus Hydrogenedentes bacterium]|nr:hypothetical protein [Candidatus Hydrogenedentota bacterium]